MILAVIITFSLLIFLFIFYLYKINRKEENLKCNYTKSFLNRNLK